MHSLPPGTWTAKLLSLLHERPQTTLQWRFGSLQRAAGMFNELKAPTSVTAMSDCDTLQQQCLLSRAPLERAPVPYGAVSHELAQTRLTDTTAQRQLSNRAAQAWLANPLLLLSLVLVPAILHVRLRPASGI